MLDTISEIIPIWLALGEVGRAIDAAGELLSLLETRGFAASFPAKAYARAASAFAAAGEPERAHELSAKAEHTLRDILARLPDEMARTGYASLPFHRGIASVARP